MINIANLLRNAKKGTILWSPLFGPVKFMQLGKNDQIWINVDNSEPFDKYGRYFGSRFAEAECLLFPGKGQTWEEWKVDTCKFKVLNWIVRNDGSSDVPIQVYGLKKDRYLVTNMLGSKGELMINRQDEYRLWSIEDAKDGDVLVCYSEVKGKPIEQAGIFKQYVGRHGGCSNTFLAHTGIDWDDNFIINGYMGSTNILPATKEQCDLLFKKMKEAGYEWDEEKKELHKTNEPMFKAGDWLWHKTFGVHPILVKDYSKQQGYKVEGLGLTYYLQKCVVENEYHHWSIENAKDGDILITENGNPFIFCGNKVYDGSHDIIAYGGLSTTGEFYESYREDCWTYNISLKPATKEQRDLLFHKMKEAGYQWDADKKELRKIQPHYDISNFHAGMPVLVRETSLNAWQYVLFSHCYIGGDGLTRFNAGLVGFTQCIPFEGNERLLGTTDPCGEEFINW